MAELTVHLTYGNALFQAAKELDKIGLISDEVEGFLEILDSEPDLLTFLNTPVISAGKKKDVVAKIFEGRLCDELLNLFYVLIDKGRTRHIVKIIGAYKDLVNKKEGFSYGKILSVKPLDENRMRRFEEETGKLLKLNVKLENIIAPDLIGGVKIFIEGKIIDASVKGRLDGLRGNMEQ